MNYRAFTATALVAVLLAGCSKQADTGPKSMEEAKAEAEKLDRPSPGQYSQTITITQFELPGAPPQAAEQIKKAMQQQQQGSFCLTEKMANEGYREMFSEFSKSGECKYQRFDVSGGRLDAVLDCQGADQGKAHIVLAGKVGSEGSDVTVNIDQDNPANPLGKAKIGMHLVSQRTGECVEPSAK